MAAPTITGTAAGSIVLQCTPGNVGPGSANGSGVWGTVGNPTFLAVINPGDVIAYIAVGGTGVSLSISGGVISPTPIPVPPGGTLFLATGSNTNIVGMTLRNVTQLTVVPST